MTIYATWNGGSSYSMSTIEDHLEVFPSVAAAKRALTERAHDGYWCKQDFHYADGRFEKAFTPNADEGPSMTVWRYDPRENTDPYPDLMITIGPRGGIRTEQC